MIQALQQDHRHPLATAMIVNFFAATVFVVLMVAFWWVIASRELEAAVQRKAKALYTLRTAMEKEPLLLPLADEMDVTMLKAKETIGPARANQAYRNHQNRQLTLMWMVPVVGVYTGLMLAAITYNVTRSHYRGEAAERHLSFGHWGGMILVLFSYIPEILFFLFVIERAIPVGDYDMGLRACGFRQ